MLAQHLGLGSSALAGVFPASETALASIGMIRA
jgi:hypothetical protein